MKTPTLPGLCRELLAKPNRAKLAVALGAAAMVLILLSELLPAPGAPAASTPETVSTAAPYKQQLEQQLEQLIGQVDGAGKTTVMLTLESGEETIYALDTPSQTTATPQTVGRWVVSSSAVPSSSKTWVCWDWVCPESVSKA